MTLNAVETLRRSVVPGFDIHIIIIESEQNSIYKFPDYIDVITPSEAFNFHKFLNIGIRAKKSDWYLLCNNDIEFDANWLTEICSVVTERPDISSFSPMCPLSSKQSKFKVSSGKKYALGYEPALHISGWCILLKHDALKQFSCLDESFSFYFADDDYGLTLRQHNLKHALVFSSLVTHLEHKKISNQLKKPTLININARKLPSYLYWNRFRWVLSNQRMLEGYMKLYEKWGDWRMLKLKKMIHNLCIFLALNRCGGVLFKPNKS